MTGQPDTHHSADIDAALVAVYLVSCVICLAVGFVLGWVFG